MENYYYSISSMQDAKDESGEMISSYKKRCNIPLLIAAIVYSIALFLPILSETVMDAAPIGISPFVLGLLMLGAIGRIGDYYVLLVGLLFVINVIMTAALLISTVTFAASQRVKKAGRVLVCNVFCFIMIPIFYTLAIYLYSLMCDRRFLGMTHIGYFVILATAVIALISLIIIIVIRDDSKTCKRKR